MHLSRSSLSCHHIELYNLISDMNVHLQNQVEGVHSYTLIKISNTGMSELMKPVEEII